MHKKAALIAMAAISLLCTAVAFSGDVEIKKMEDSLARGYMAANVNDIEGAFKLFSQSIPLAEKANSWKGLVDIGNAFSALGKPEQSLSLFKKAHGIAYAQKDWRGLVSAAYGYASLPDNPSGKKAASVSLETASKVAGSEKDWRGLVEAANAFDKIGRRDRAQATLEATKKIVKNIRSASIASTVGDAAEKLGCAALRDEYSAMAKEFGRESKTAAPPPPGWKPYGESVAGPQKISVEAQQAMRASADKDIDSKREYLAQLEKKEEKAHQYHGVFRNYYDYPYYHTYIGFGPWRALNAAQISGWASRCFSNYRLEDNAYVYIY